MSVIFRIATPADGAALVAFFQAVDAESRFLLYEPGERTTSAAEWGKRVERANSQQLGIYCAAEDDAAPGEIVGLVLGFADDLARVRHTLNLVVAVRQAYAGQGIATRLYEMLEAWARAHGFHRLHLETASDNERAVALYKRWGFAIEGYHRHAVRLRDRWVDDYTMGKLLE